MSIGKKFHNETSLTWLGALGDVISPKPKRPPQFKSYKSAKRIKLPKPKHRGMTIEDTLKERRSKREYSTKALTLDKLSQLLFSAQGITGKVYGTYLRSAPSAGALYPFEIYPVVNNIKGIERGVYHYSVLDHSLELIKSGDFRNEIISTGLKQEMLGESGVTFIWLFRE